MNKELNLLSLFLITALNSSCAIAMGQRKQCEAVVIPSRPNIVTCISNAQGVGQCYNPATDKWEILSMNNYVCFSGMDHFRDEQWIKSVLEATGN